MKISLIAAMTNDRVIGRDGGMPWHLPADLKWFKANTLGKPVIMGRRTYDTIGRPLPNRTNIVLTRQRDLTLEGCVVVHSLDEAISAAGEVEELMIIGGATLYEAALPMAQRMYLTMLDASIEGDTYFPEFTAGLWDWELVEDRPADEKNAHDMTFFVLDLAV